MTPKPLHIRKYFEPTEGEWIQPIRKGYKLACCSCGLVHRVDFRVYKRRVQVRFWRDNRATAAVRRERRKQRGRQSRER